MAGSGELIYAARNAFIADFIPVFQDIYSRIAQGSEQVSLSYRSHCQRGPLLDVIRAGRDKDRIMGFSLHGVHRDDLDMLIGDYPLKKEGSQGQHKTFALALKLAQFDFLRKTASATRYLSPTPIATTSTGFYRPDLRTIGSLRSVVAR